MTNIEQIKESITVMHNLIAKGKFIAFDASSPNIIVEYLDDIEYLPIILASQEVDFNLFSDHVKFVCNKYKFYDILNRFESLQ